MKVKRIRKPLFNTARTVCIGGAALGVAAGAMADDAETADLKARVASLEALAAKEGLLPSGKKAPKFVSSLSDISVSGFVTASYFIDTSNPADNSPNAYLWNRNSGDFSINKFKLTVASKPVEASGEEWDAAFRASLIWGEDAPIVNTGGEAQGFEDLREAYVELNAPVGTGLNIRAGQLISLLNWESGDGGAANPNFSQGNQWFYTGNGPSAGVQLGYQFCDTVGAKVRVQNGMYAGPFDANDAKTLMASLNFKPSDKFWFNVIGFSGEEGGAIGSLQGGSIIGGYQINEKLGTGFELDYFNFDLAAGGHDDLSSIGGWLWYDFTSTLGVAFRAEYIHDADGFGTGGLLGFPANTGADIYGLTVTLNYKPVPNVKIQPEIRFDGTDLNGGFDGEDSRLIVGIGASYMF